MKFTITSPHTPAGDQPYAIEALTEGIMGMKKNQILKGITGSGKTFTMAHVIQNLQCPTLIMAHNKTLAAQLYNEMKGFFPENAVEYFVSYYDYYQPEAYIPRTDTYIEKDSSINEYIDRLRHSATRALLERKDVIVIASVSCIYGLGSPELYLQMTQNISVGMEIKQKDLINQCIALQYDRNDIQFMRGTFRVRGDLLEIFPSHYENRSWKISFFGNSIDSIKECDALTGDITASLETITIFANSHYVTPRPTLQQALILIEEELEKRVDYFRAENKLIEAQRIEERTRFDLEMIRETGMCKGIENYSRYLSGRKAGQPPPTLFEYLPKESLLFIDESHVTIPQVGGMYHGDRSRKMNLVEYGFRLPSALDNRPLKFEEWDGLRPITIAVSATPGKYELAQTHHEVIEQIIRPTGLIDPVCIVKPVATQIDDLLHEAKKTIAQGHRVLVTTLTKKMAEAVCDYMQEAQMKVAYLHSDIQTIERMDILMRLRQGIFDVLVGVNLLREGLDLPECALVAILDADKEGLLRSETALIQTIGRAARNIEGRVILYADVMTGSITRALAETNRRREIQTAYNEEHNITPKTIIKALTEILKQPKENEKSVLETIKKDKDPKKHIENLRKEMRRLASEMQFEEAALIRDLLKTLE